MKEITDIARSQPKDGFATVKLVDKTDDTNDDSSDDGTLIQGQNYLNRVVTSNMNFINELVAVNSLGINIRLHY